MKAIFAFSGQGAQAVGMGKDLYENSPEAKKIFDLADEVLGYPLTEIIFNGPQEKLTETRYFCRWTQAALQTCGIDGCGMQSDKGWHGVGAWRRCRGDCRSGKRVRY